MTEGEGARPGVEARGFLPLAVLVGGRDGLDCLRRRIFFVQILSPSVELGDRVGSGVQSYNCVLNH